MACDWRLQARHRHNADCPTMLQVTTHGGSTPFCTEDAFVSRHARSMPDIPGDKHTRRQATVRLRDSCVAWTKGPSNTTADALDVGRLSVTRHATLCSAGIHVWFRRVLNGCLSEASVGALDDWTRRQRRWLRGQTSVSVAGCAAMSSSSAPDECRPWMLGCSYRSPKAPRPRHVTSYETRHAPLPVCWLPTASTALAGL